MRKLTLSTLYAGLLSVLSFFLLPSAGAQQVAVSWNTADFPGATSFDVEWTYIDGMGARGVAFSNPSAITDAQVASWMRNDNTRATVASPPYVLSLPYTSGYVTVRVRGVYYNGDGVRVATAWQYRTGGNLRYLTVAGHEPGLNWQYNGSFAEGGKKKEVTGYFDATLRSRQSVTLLNSEGRAVVAEKVYDNMGRPAVDVLPAPQLQGRLGFYPSLNRNLSGAAYSHADINTDSCAASAGAMSTASGASGYYSPANLFLGNASYPFTPYVPDAGGYPYALTQYVADNTGRVRRQGGVGPALQPGTGHETVYFYGKPAQEELWRMFGSDAGDATHYLKNMVVDPNGQVSVSYLDAAGRTVATALAGNAPVNLDPLASSRDALTRMDRLLVGNADFATDRVEQSRTATATFLAAVTGDFRLHYSVSPRNLPTSPLAGGAFCTNCYYVLKVSVRDDCGRLVASDSTVPFQVDDFLCHGNLPDVTDSLDVPVARIGEYTVAYSLALSNEVVASQVEYYLAHDSDLKQLQAFFQESLDSSDLASCYTDCSTCRVRLGTKEHFMQQVLSVMDSIAADKYAGLVFDPASPGIRGWASAMYDSLLAVCNANRLACGESPCEQRLSVMKMDVQPGGQYALYKVDSSSGVAVYSFLDLATNVMRYYNDPSKAQVYGLKMQDASGDSVFVHGLSVSDFVAAYLQHPEWADGFVTLHVEYCAYLWCKDGSNPDKAKNNEASYYFDQMLTDQVTTGSLAVGWGYFSRTDPYALVGEDPFFNGGNGTLYRGAMVNDLATASDVYRLTPYDNTGKPLATKNVLELGDWKLYCMPAGVSTPQQVVDSWGSCSPSPECRSLTAEWESYRDYYLQLKSKYMAAARRDAMPDCKTCFIGSDGFPGCTEGGATSAARRAEEARYGVFAFRPSPARDSSVQRMAAGVPVVHPVPDSSAFRTAAKPLAGAVYATVNPDTCMFLAAGDTSNGYMMDGTTVFQPGFNSDGTGAAAATMTTVGMWRNNINSLNYHDGPLNRVSLWPREFSTLVNTWVPVTRRITVPATKTYYVGISGDNNVRLAVDGTTYVTTNDAETFKRWRIYPIALTAGTHILVFSGKNNESLRAVGCEVYDNTVAQLSSATSPSQLNILYSTQWDRDKNVNCGGPSADTCMAVCEGGRDKGYSMSPTPVMAPGFDGNGNGTVAFYLNTPGLWRNTCSDDSCGPLNRSSVWPCAYRDSLNRWVQFNRGITVPETGTYYIGFSADNYGRLSVDGEQVFYSFTDTTFRSWRVFPVTLVAGRHVLTLGGYDVGTIQAIGCEVYRNTAAELKSATKLSDLNVVYSTAWDRGGYVNCGAAPPQICLTPVAGTRYKTYSTRPTEIYAVGYSPDGSGALQAKLEASPLWRNGPGDAAAGPLNRASVWPAAATGLWGQWLTVTGKATVPSSGTYYVGFSGDNKARLTIDGTDVVTLSSDTVFNTWRVYPVYLTQGVHRVTVGGFNNENEYAVGCEVYGNSLASLMAATQLSDLTILYSTASGAVSDCQEVPSSSCADDPRHADYGGKERRWDDYANIEGLLAANAYGNGCLPGVAGGTGGSTRQVYDNALSQLQAEKDNWVAALAAARDEEPAFSGITDPQIATIADGLYTVAKAGLDTLYARYGRDSLHVPVGSVRGVSTLAPDVVSPNGYHGFLEVFNAVVGVTSVSQGFGPDLLSSPYPWGKGPVAADPNVTRPDSVTCARLAALRARFDATTGGGDTLAFHNWLRGQLGGGYMVTYAQLADLVRRCAYGCSQLDEPLVLPAVFGVPPENNPDHPWATCGRVGSLVNDSFPARYGGVVRNDSVRLYRVLLEGVLNHALGYTLSYGEYRDFLDSCAAGGNPVLYSRSASPTAPEDSTACTAARLGDVFSLAGQSWKVYVDSVRAAYRTTLVGACLSTSQSARVTGDMYEYHYTLYYYDRAGNLARTVPPEGVSLLTDMSTAPTTQPAHRLSTAYTYNSLNATRSRTTPDAGTANYWYDRLGRITASQDAEQLSPLAAGAPAGRYSFTRYDLLGRVVATGEKLGAAAMGEPTALDPAALTAWLASGSDRQVTLTAYDVQPPWVPAPLAGRQGNLRHRVAASVLLSRGNDPAASRFAASYYDYDIDGNVANLVLEDSARAAAEAPFVTGGDGLRRLAYDYDLISGKVNKVGYQHGLWDQYHYLYRYDADNRVTEALSSRTDDPDTARWRTDARYRYYLHGPLARMELGGGVQGVDYAYTLQGWVKGNNGVLMRPAFDMGGDGAAGSTVAPDVYAYSLGYYNGDYSAIGGSAYTAFAKRYAAPVPDPTGAVRSTETGLQLFNGNIGSATYALRNIGGDSTVGYTYRYDQLNRLVGTDHHTPLSYDAQSWDNGNTVAAYRERAAYDANGNILRYLRNGAAAVLGMDSLTYKYPLDAGGHIASNRLLRIRDSVPAANYSVDIDDQAAENNYGYDRNGNLVGDVSEGIAAIAWTPYGKIDSVTRSDGTLVRYGYDPAGNRLWKRVKAGGATRYTYYVRDGQGNTMGVYESGDGQWRWQEQQLYGSSRLGMLRPGFSVPLAGPLPSPGYNPAGDPASNDSTGKKLFELSNHLGNVLSTVSDLRVKGLADVRSAQDYYPFGMRMPGRNGYSVGYGSWATGETLLNGVAVPQSIVVSDRMGNQPAEYKASGSVRFTPAFHSGPGDLFRAYIANSSNTSAANTAWPEGLYRYGYNGKENDNEVKGVGDQIDYGARIYDPRVGRFYSVDPIADQYPELSRYQYASNRPVDGIDLDGEEFRYYLINFVRNKETGKTVFIRPTLWRTEYSVTHRIETIFGTKSIEIPRTGEASVANIGNYNYKFPNYEAMRKATDVLKDPEMERLAKECNCLPGANLANTVEAEEKIGQFLQGIGNSAATGLAVGDALRSFKLLKNGVSSAIKDLRVFMSSATSPSKNNLTVVGRALQKHAGRKGSSFSNIQFSGKTGDQQGIDVLNEILNSKNQFIDRPGNGTATIFDKNTGRGVNVSRRGEFNGFRDIKEK